MEPDEIDEALSWSGQNHPGCLAGDQALEMQQVDQPTLDKLRFDERCGHPDDRLVGVEDRAFRHGVDIAGEPKLC